MKFKQSSHLIAILTSSILWGFFSLSLRKLNGFPSEVILNWRVISSFLIIWIILLFFKIDIIKTTFQRFKVLKKKEKTRILGLVFISGILLTLNWLYFIYVTNHVSLKAAAFAYIVCPLITAVAGFILLKEHLNRLKIAALILALVSIVGLASGSLHEVLWSILIASLYSFFLIIQRMLKEFDKLLMLGVQLLIAFILILPMIYLHQKAIPHEINFWVQIIIISVFFTIAPLLLSLYALKGLPSSTVGITIYINPIISYSVAYVFFNEVISRDEIVYYVILFFAVIIFNGDILLNIFSSKFKSVKELDIQN